MTLLSSRIAAGVDPVLSAQDGRSISRADLAAEHLGPAAASRLGPRVVVCLRDPLSFVRALVAMDGRIAALILVSWSLPDAMLVDLAHAAQATGILTDRDPAALRGAGCVAVSPQEVLAGASEPAGATPTVTTDWLMTTSGTTGMPRIVPQGLAALAHRIRPVPAGKPLPLWGLMIDPTRFSGLLMVLQALIGGGRLMLADPASPLAAQLEFLAGADVTHLSGAPTLWRRILMQPGHRALRLAQITLVGESADQATLTALATIWPGARITHIYGSTEAGQGFSVSDGRAGFPAAWLDDAPGGLALSIRDGILWLRPAPGAERVASAHVTVDETGYVRTGDRVQVTGERVLFLGRDNGVINVGGIKVWPEAVEAVIRAIPGVGLAQVIARANPVTGALVEAQVVPLPGTDPAALKAAILAACRAALPREAVPTLLRLVEDLATNAAGKLLRPASGTA